MGITERKEREKQQRRNAIIDAAERVFFAKGIGVATMDEVAEEAELSKGTLYLYFKSKEELHFAINMRAADILYEYFSNAVKDGRNGLEKTRFIGKAYVEFLKKYPDYFGAIMYFQLKDVESFCKDNESVKDHKKRNPLKILVQAVEKGIEDGSIRNDLDPHIISHSLWAMSTGVLQHISSQKLELHKHKEGKAIDPDETLNALFEIIRKGISNEE